MNSLIHALAGSKTVQGHVRAMKFYEARGNETRAHTHQNILLAIISVTAEIHGVAHLVADEHLNILNALADLPEATA